MISTKFKCLWCGNLQDNRFRCEECHITYLKPIITKTLFPSLWEAVLRERKPIIKELSDAAENRFKN